MFSQRQLRVVPGQIYRDQCSGDPLVESACNSDSQTNCERARYPRMA